MGLLNITVFTENDLIKVRFSFIQTNNEYLKDAYTSQLIELKKTASNEIFGSIDRFQEYRSRDLIKDALNCSPAEALQTALNCKQVADLIFYEKDNEQTKYNYTSLVFELSKTPHLAVNWVIYLSRFVNRLNDNLRISFEKDNFIELLNDSADKSLLVFSQKVSDYQKNIDLSGKTILILLEKLSAFKSEDLPQYKLSLEALNKLYAHYLKNRSSKNQLPIVTTLEHTTEFQLFWGNVQKKLFEDKSSENTKDYLLSFPLKEEFLVSFMHEHFNQNREDELTYFTKRLELFAKARWFEQCIGRKAHDGGKYSFPYTEWSVINKAVFYEHEDGTVEIVNIKDNPGYKKFYAKGERNHHLFHPEFVFWFKLMGLETLPQCTDFHEGIVFTKQSSALLKEMGLLLCSELHLKSLLYVDNCKKLLTCKGAKINPSLPASEPLPVTTDNKEPVVLPRYETHPSTEEHNSILALPVELLEISLKSAFKSKVSEKFSFFTPPRKEEKGQGQIAAPVASLDS